MQNNLCANDLKPPSEFTTNLIGSFEQQELLEELLIHLETHDKGDTPYGGDVGKWGQSLHAGKLLL